MWSQFDLFEWNRRTASSIQKIKLVPLTNLNKQYDPNTKKNKDEPDRVGKNMSRVRARDHLRKALLCCFHLDKHFCLSLLHDPANEDREVHKRETASNVHKREEKN